MLAPPWLRYEEPREPGRGHRVPQWYGKMIIGDLGPVSKVVLTVWFAVFGVASLAHSFVGKDFRFAIRGSDEPGPQMPRWLGRPFFFLMGVGFLWLAFEPWIHGWNWGNGYPGRGFPTCNLVVAFALKYGSLASIAA